MPLFVLITLIEFWPKPLELFGARFCQRTPFSDDWSSIKVFGNYQLLELSHGFCLRELCCWPNSLFGINYWLFQKTARMIICTTTLTINKGESHLDIRSLVSQFSRRCPLSGSQNQRNWDSGNSETSKFLPKCRAGDLCIDYWNKANHHHFHHYPHPHHPHTQRYQDIAW